MILNKLPAAAVPALCFLALVAGSQAAQAQELRSLSVGQPAVAVGASLPIQIDLDIRAETRPYCGLMVDFGDGSSQDVRAGENGAGDFPVRLNHVYKNPGQYTLRVEGKFLTRGLFSASSCKGGLGAVASDLTGFGVCWGIALLESHR